MKLVSCQMKMQIHLFPDQIYKHKHHLVLDATSYVCLFLLDKLFYEVKRAEHLQVAFPREAYSQVAKWADERA